MILIVMIPGMDCLPVAGKVLVLLPWDEPRAAAAAVSANADSWSVKKNDEEYLSCIFPCECCKEGFLEERGSKR